MDPTRHPLEMTGLFDGDDEDALDINCASDFVSRTLDHSEGVRGKVGGRRGEGVSSSSLALTTVDSLDGRWERILLESPVIFVMK